MPQTYSWLPWGKNFRTLPAVIETALAALPPDAGVVIGCTKALSAEDLTARRYVHLKIFTPADIPDTPISLLPSPNVGRSSHRNASVLEEVVKTQGKQPKRIESRAPDWRGGGLHTIHYWRNVWPRRLVLPSMSRLGFQRVDAVGSPDSPLLVRFHIQEVLDPSHPDFRNEVLRCVNLLQENVGAIDVLPPDAATTGAVRHSAEHIGWELLPNANFADTREAMARRFGTLAEKNPDLVAKAQQRLQLMLQLKPRHLFQGAGGFAGYFAAVFTDDLVVFENLELDHAVYVLRGDWHALSRLTRTELRTHSAGRIDCIVHTPGWEERLLRLVRHARGEQIDPQGELFPSPPAETH